jgi:MGT family glycosyltransferase
MSRFLFSTAPLPGHLDWGGLLETARLLQDRGHDVLWASGAAVAPVLEQANIRVALVPIAFQIPTSNYAESVDKAESYALAVRRTLSVWLQEDQVAAACDAHLRLIAEWQPDAVIADPMVLAAALAAEAGDLPLAACGYPGPLMVVQPTRHTAPIITDFFDTLNRLRNRIGLPACDPSPAPDLLFRAPDLHLVFFSHEWFERYNPHPSPGAQFVGGSVPPSRIAPPPWIADLPADRPLIVVADSTVYGPPSSQLALVFEAIGKLGAYGIIGGSPQKRAAFEPLPEYICWQEWVPYDYVLPHAAALVHHGGMGTTHAGIRHGVPQLVTPAAVDQFIHAQGVMDTGIGIAIPPGRVSSAVLALGLENLLNNPDYRSAATKQRAHFAQLGGIDRAATLLVDLAEQKRCR